MTCATAVPIDRLASSLGAPPGQGRGLGGRLADVPSVAHIHEGRQLDELRRAWLARHRDAGLHRGADVGHLSSRQEKFPHLVGPVLQPLL